MKLLLGTLTLLSLFSCNADHDPGDQGHREEMEEVTKPNDYTQGTDVKDVPHRPD